MVMMSVAAIAHAGDVESILGEIDPWVTTDTAKIMSYIDSANAVTKAMLEENPYWESTQKELGFLLGIDLVTSPQIDNTGRIYFTMRLTGESQALFYMDGPMGWPIQLTPNSWPDEGFIISGFAAHPSGDFIIVRVNKFGDEMHDLWRFERDGSFKPLLESRTVRYVGPIYDEDNADQFYLYTQAGPNMHICRYTMSTGTLDTLYTEPGAFYPVDYDNNNIIWVRYLSFSEAHLMLLDVGTGEVKTLTESGLTYGGTFTEDGNIALLTSVKSTEDEFMKFCMIDQEDIVESVKPEDIKIIFDPKVEVEDFAFIKKKNTVIAAMNLDGYSKLIAFDLNGNTVDVPQPEIGVAGGLSTNDLGDIVFSFSSPTTAPTAFKFSIGDTEIQQIGKMSTFGFDFSDISVEVIRYKSDDGLEIPALLYVPKTANRDGSNPAIINYHGGPPGQSRPYFQRNIAFALSKGFVVMFPNVRGSTGYGPAYERMDNLEGRFASLVDCERAIDYLIDQKLSNPDQIAVWGASYGGYVVNWLATTCPEKIACVVSDVGISDVDWTNQKSKNQNFSQGWEREMGTIGSDLTRELSPIFKAENASVPTLVTAGFFDPRVPPSDPRRFAYVLSSLGKPVWYYEETEAGHGGSFKKQIIFDLSRSYAFTMQHVMK
jgi:protease II